MSDLMKYAHGLAEDIGPRPVNSEEEQRSSYMIADWFSEKGLDPHVEEFSCPVWVTWPYVVAYLLAALAAFLSYFHGGVGVVMLVLALLALVFFFYERFLKGAVEDRFRKGMSQNVVAKYVPRNISNEARRRKIIVVAHYDSERDAIESSPSIVDGFPVLQKAAFICMILIPVLMILEMLPLMSGVVKWIWLLSCFVALLPIVAAVSMLLRRFAMPYNDGANNNASGVAAMMGVIERVIPTDLRQAGRADESKDRPSSKRSTHDARTARKAGAVDDDVELDYAVEQDDRPRGHKGYQHTGEVRRGRSLADGGSSRESSARRLRGKRNAEHADDETDMAADETQSRDGADMRRPSGRGTGRISPDTIATRSESVEDLRAASRYAREGAASETGAIEDDMTATGAMDRVDARMGQGADAVPADEGGFEHPRDQRIFEQDSPKSRDTDMPARTPDMQAQQAEIPARQAEPQIGSVPMKNAATGTVSPRRVEQRPASQPASSVKRTPVKPVTTTPSWWTKAESMRKNDKDEAAAEEIKKARSHFADMPSAEKVRAEAERLAAEKAAKEAEEERKRKEAEARRKRREAGIDEEAARRLSQMEQQVAKEESALDNLTVHTAPSSTGTQKAISLPVDDILPAELPVETDVPVRSGEPAVTTAPRRLDERLVNLPSLDDTGGLQAMSQHHIPDLIADGEFGAPQAAPVSSEYADTPQRTGMTGEIANLPSTEEPPRKDGASAKGTRKSDADPDTFSPFAAGTFAAGETGAFVPIGNTESFFPVDADVNDIFIDDADDSTISDVPMGGDFNAPASIDIPESRTHRFMDKASNFFSHGKGREDDGDVSASEWLGVDKDYNARKAGKDIGSWDNFDESDNDDDWKGGAARYPGSDLDETSTLELERNVTTMAREDFLDKEVWFVALGAHGAGSAGMKDFISRHASELSGSTIVNLDCVGAGEICYLEREGVGRSVQSDYRMQSLIGKIAHDLGGNVEIESLEWMDTDATVALRAGLRAITLMGFDRKAPVSWNQKTDTCEILEPSRLSLTADLVTEIIHNS